MWVQNTSSLFPLCPIPCQHREPLAALFGEASQGGHSAEDVSASREQPCTDSAPGNKPVLRDSSFHLLPAQKWGNSLPGSFLQAGGWCRGGGSWQHWQGCGVRLESCVVQQCTCASGCHSPGISRVLDSWEQNAGMLMWKEVTTRKWKPLEAYQGMKPCHNIPPGQIRITLMQWFIIFFPLLFSQWGDATDLDWYCWVCKICCTLQGDAGQIKCESCSEELVWMWAFRIAEPWPSGIRVV